MLNKALLREPFPAASVKEREGSGNNRFKYVPVGSILERILDATDGEFDWTVERLEFISDGKKGFWLCVGQLTIAGLGTRTGIGTASPMNEDAPKSAESDAIKRAGVKFGVALDLYQSDAAAPAAHANRAASRQPGPLPIHPGPGRCPYCNAPEQKVHANSCPTLSQAA